MIAPAECESWDDHGDHSRRRLLRERQYLALPKVDGVRCRIHLANGVAQAVTAHGVAIPCLTAGLGELARQVGGDVILESEFVHQDGTWASTMAALADPSPRADVRVRCFDLIAAGAPGLPAAERWALLDRLPLALDPRLDRLRRTRVVTLAEVDRVFAATRAAGFEGLVLHDAAARYTSGRSSAWIKVKAWQSDDLRVESSTQGGSLIVAGIVAGVPVRVTLANGLAPATRQAIRADPAAWRGRLIEVRHTGPTGAGSLRDAVALRVRADRPELSSQTSE